jgi:hypothetical protein
MKLPRRISVPSDRSDGIRVELFVIYCAEMKASDNFAHWSKPPGLYPHAIIRIKTVSLKSVFL